MRVVFDQKIFLLQEYGGISRYVCSLASALNKIDGIEPEIIAPFHYNAHLEELTGTKITACRLPKINKTSRIVSSISEFVANQLIRVRKPEIVHETYYSNKALVNKKCASVITVYDMIVERFPDQFVKSELETAQKYATISRADHVICISESTRRDLLDYFNIPENKVSVIYLGNDEFPPIQFNDVYSTQASKKPYLLYVGSRGGYKNFEGMLRGVAASQYLKNNFSITCFGGGKFTNYEIDLIVKLGLDASQINQLTGGDDLLAQLYKKAAAFIYPSFYEGFGIPPLEAMSLGCPVICSDTSSIPEVVGNAGRYFDPSDTDSITHAIERVLQSSSYRDELIKNGYMNCSNFSWSRCAEETAAIYRNIL